MNGETNIYKTKYTHKHCFIYTVNIHIHVCAIKSSPYTEAILFIVYLLCASIYFIQQDKVDQN